MALMDDFSSAWPWIMAATTAIGIVYAIIVRHLNDHPLHGPWWESQCWIEVVIGEICIGVSAWALAGLRTLIAVLLASLGMGTPMIVGCLWRLTRREDERVGSEAARAIDEG